MNQAVNLGWLLLVLGLGPLSKWLGVWGLAEVGCYLFERIWEDLKLEPRQAFIRKSHC